MEPRNLILIAEDEPVVASVCSRVLEGAGYSVYVCANGRSALELYRRNRDRIVLVISDAGMPVMDDLELAAQILAIDSEAKILIMTGNDPLMVVPLHLRQACNTIGKPFYPKHLLSAVAECMETKRPRGPAGTKTHTAGGVD